MAFWERTKTNRLKKPSSFKPDYDTPTDERFESKKTFYGQMWPIPGEFVFLGNSPSAGTVGKVLRYDSELACHGGPAVEVEMLSGEIKLEWVTYALVIDYDAVQEVKDFYIADGRPGRIKVAW